MKARIHHVINSFCDRANQLSEKKKRIMLAFFCLSIFCASIYILATIKDFHPVFIQKIHLHSHIGKSFSVPQPFISKEAFVRIENFKRQLDSQAMRERPGLVDSIALFEKIYHSQSKK